MEVPPSSKRDGEAAESGPGTGGGADVCRLIVRLKYLLTLVLLTVLQYGSVGPSTQFITLNFFALEFASPNASATIASVTNTSITNASISHGNAADEQWPPNCEATPSSEPCRSAAAQATFIQGMTGAASKSVAWLLALTLGGYSDRVGRRPIFQAKTTFSLLPTVSLALHVFFGLTLWVYLVIGPIYEMFDINGVFLALLTDVVKNPEERGKAFATFIALVVAMAAVVIPLAGFIPMTAAVAVSLVAAIAKVVFIFVSFPETAPLVQKVEDQKTGLHGNGLFAIAGNACAVLRRNTFISRMAIVLIVSGLASAGSQTINSAYFTAYMGLKRSDTAVFFIVAGLSLAFTFTCISGPLTRKLGDVRTLQFSLCASVLTPLAIIASATKWQLWAVSFVLFGPSFLQVPIITAIKSNLVGQHEQGLVQGALASVRVVAVAVADAFFGWFYRYATDKGRAPDKSAADGPYLFVAFLSLCALGIACTLPLELPKPEDEPASTKEGGDAREVELVGLKDNQDLGGLNDSQAVGA